VSKKTSRLFTTYNPWLRRRSDDYQLWKCNSDSFQVNDLQGDLDVKDGKISELQNEVQAQAETAARQNTIIHSLRGRLQVLDQTDKSVSSLYLSSS
jgi:hypothetical protein